MSLLVTSMGESDVILTCNEPTEKASKYTKVLEGGVWNHLASKGSQAGLQEEAQSSLRDEAGWQRALYG